MTDSIFEYVIVFAVVLNLNEKFTIDMNICIHDVK